MDTPKPNASCLGFVKLSEILEKSEHEPRQALCMEKSLEAAQVGLQVGWCEFSGNHQVKANSVSQVDRDSVIEAMWGKLD